MNATAKDHPIAIAIADNRYAEQFFDLERATVKREYQRLQDARFGRKRKKANIKIEDRISQKQRARNLKKLGVL